MKETGQLVCSGEAAIREDVGPSRWGTVLITGASGLLGVQVALAARARFGRVVAVHRRHPVHLEGVENACVDLADESKVEELCQAYGPSWLVHCAAVTDVDWCEEHPQDAWQANVDISRRLAEAARRVGARVVYVSTDSVFDGTTGGYSETDAARPPNVYARTKLAGEQAVAGAGPDALIIRTNLYGWNIQDKLSLAEWVLHSLRTNRSVPGFRDVIFAPLLANDLAELILEMMSQNLTGIYHVAAADFCSKYEFARKVADTFGLDREGVHPATIRDVRLRAPRPANTSLRTDKIARDLGRTMPKLQTGLDRFRKLHDDGFVQELKRMRKDSVHGKA